MFVFEEVITCSAEAKTQLSQYACNFPPNHKGGLVAKYELRPPGCCICPSTKLVVGLMNSQCYGDNPFSSNLSLLSLEGPKKNETDFIILFYRGVFKKLCLCFFLFVLFFLVRGVGCAPLISRSLSLSLLPPETE